MSRFFINKFVYTWRYYGFRKEAYKKCMGEAFANNIDGLIYTNILCLVLALCFAVFFALSEKTFLKAGIYCTEVLVALSLYIFARRVRRLKKALGRRTVYSLIALSYANIMLFGTYIGVWANRGQVAVSIIGFIIVALLLFTVSPVFTLAASSCALFFFIISTVLYKDASIWIYDVQNIFAAYAICLVVNWVMNKYRLHAVLSAMELKEERDKWFSRSTIDPLTQLNNRRTFIQTFQRYLTNHRDRDKWIGLAVIDIDYFKEYNDYYGHLKGDELIQSLGGVLNGLQASRGVFAARTGGDEFALLWLVHEQAGADDADDVLSYLQEKVAELAIPHAKSKVSQNLTVSIGIYIARLDRDDTVSLVDTMKAIYNSADEALYEAKRSGKNRGIIRRENRGGVVFPH